MCALFVAGCASAAPPGAVQARKVVTWAEGAGAPPTYIFPLESGAEESQQNSYWFSNQFFLPLYWYGIGTKPTINYGLSLAYPPLFSNDNTRVTIRLKHWRWSTGAPVTARDVIFWLNLLSAVTDPRAPVIGSSSAPGPGWGTFVPGAIPENIVSYKADGEYSVVLSLNGSYNPTWYTYNELSQIIPLPVASWDKLTASGVVGNYDLSAGRRVAVPGTTPAQYITTDPGTSTSGALGVAQFLNLQSQDLGTYSTNPLWQVVDGPFRLAQFTTSGFVKMVPNRDYSGSPKPKIAAFEEEPFTSDTAEYTALRSGSLTVGYVPPADIGTIPSLEHSKGLAIAPWQEFGIQYMAYNFTNPTVGPLFRQLYFRQAFQSLVNQRQFVKVFDHGYGTVENGIAPTYPPHNQFESPLLAKGQLYPYDPKKAVSLLRSHGWQVEPGGQSFCAKAGTGSDQCGAGVRGGQRLSFQLLIASGNTAAANEMTALQSTLSSTAGVQIAIKQEAFSQVIATAFGGCTVATPCSTWQLGDWLGGWSFAPDFLPTGGELFATSSGSNVGDYSNAINDRNIVATHTAPTTASELTSLYTYENYLSGQLPVALFPQTPFSITAYRSGLRGAQAAQDVYGVLAPQFYG